MNDEQIYAEVVDELRKNSPNPGLWAKVFAEANGDESIAKAKYLRIRAQQISTQRSHVPAPTQPTVDGALSNDVIDRIVSFIAAWSYPAVMALLAALVIFYFAL